MSRVRGATLARVTYADGLDPEELAFQRLYGPVPADCAELMAGADLAAALPLLPPHRRDWLRDMVAHLHPGHAWLPRLAEDSAE